MIAIENALLALVLGAIVLVPLIEATLRKFFDTGISNAASVVQHLTLVAGMLGAAVAARENRLLVLSKLGGLLPRRLRVYSHIFTGSWSVAVSAMLAFAGWRFVEAERPFANYIAYGVPEWIVELCIPVAFAAIAWRLVGHSMPRAGEERGDELASLEPIAETDRLAEPSSEGAATTGELWTGRAATAILAVVWIVLGYRWPMPTLGVLGVATLLGLPAFVTLAGVSLALFHQAGEPIAAITISHYSLATNTILPTIPMFTLAGYFLASGGAPDRLLDVFRTLFGKLRGGPAIVAAAACTFFTSFTGGSGVTILALGGLLMPLLLGRGYKQRDALGLITGAGSLGLLLPPCLPLILFAVVAKTPIERMFLGGLLPAAVMLAATAAWGIAVQGRDAASSEPFSWSAALQSLGRAKWDLLMPFVALASLFGGFATPVEAAAVTALYAFCIEVFIHRSLKFTQDAPRVMAECGLLIGGVLLVQGVALGFTNYLVDAEFLTKAAEWTTGTIHSRWVFLLALNLFLLVIGCLMEIYAAIVIQAPLLVTIGAAYGVDPVHLGIIFLANMELGYLTPPVGLNLLVSSLRFKKSVPEVLRAVTPLTIVMAVGVLLITYVPALTTALPSWFGY